MPQNKKRQTNTCIVCGNAFETGGRAGDTKKQTCSRSCQAYARVRVSGQAQDMQPTQAAYLAGLIDGEGSFIFYERHGVTAFRLTISNTKKELFEWLINTTGVGSVVTHRRTSEMHSDSMWWQVNGYKAIRLVEQIAPYLTIKQEQAKLAIELLKLHAENPSVKLKPDIETSYRLRMRALNARGTRQVE